MIVRIKDIKELLNSDSLSVDDKMSMIAVVVLEFVGLFEVLNLVLCGYGIFAPVSVLAFTLLNPVMFLLTQKLFGWSMEAKYILVAILPLFVSVLWFITGGNEGGANLWFAYVLIFGILMIEKDKQWVAIVLATTVYLATYCLGHHFPWLVTDIRQGARIYICSFVTILIHGISLGAIVRLQKFTMEVQQKRLIDARDEIEASNEELIAVNSELSETGQKLAAKNEELEDLSQKLEESLRNQTNFTNSLNHELRSPLNGIIGCLELIKEEEISSQVEEYVDNALLSSQLMIDTVNNMLDYSSMQAGKFDIISAQFCLEELSKMVDASQKTLALKKGLHYMSDSSVSGTQLFVGDKKHIAQIAINLVSNAIKYTAAGSVTVHYDLTQDHKCLCIKVSDTGQGISEDGIRILFEPFSRLNKLENMDIQGTGLGLSIVKNLIEQMGGNIQVESTLGAGSTFVVSIPVEVLKEQYASVAQDERDLVDDFAGRCILAIDDTEINLKIIQGLFKNTGATVDVASSGLVGLHMVTQKTYDLVLIDHIMPEMNGIDTYKEMKKYDHNLKVVMMTGNTGEEYKKEYEELGFAGYIVKPIQKDAFFATLQNIMK